MSTAVSKTDAQNTEMAARAAVLGFTKALGRRRKSSADMIDEIFEKAGGPLGRDATVEAIALINKKAIDRGLDDEASNKEVEIGLKAADLLLRANQDADKRSGPAIDISGIPEEELRDLLMEPARQLILTDDVFLRQLLSMPEIRKRMSSIIEAEATNAEA